MKYSQMKRFLMEHKDSMKPPYISTLDGILTAGGELIGYQELEMDSPYLDVHEDTSYTKDYVTLHSHEFYELLFCRSGNLQYLIGNTRYQIRKNDIILVPPGTSHRPLFLEQLREPYQRTVLWINNDFFETCKQNFFADTGSSQCTTKAAPLCHPPGRNTLKPDRPASGCTVVRGFHHASWKRALPHGAFSAVVLSVLPYERPSAVRHPQTGEYRPVRPDSQLH